MKSSLCTGRSGKSCQENPVNEERDFWISIWVKSTTLIHAAFRRAYTYCLQLTAGEADSKFLRTTGTHVNKQHATKIPFAADGDNVQVLRSSDAF